MRSVLVTDWGNFELSESVAEKIAAYPKHRYISPYTGEVIEWQDMSHPTLARYMRLITNHMMKEAGA